MCKWWRWGNGTFWWATFLLFISARMTWAADLAEGRKLFLKGNYAESNKQAELAIKDASWGDAWPILLAKGQLVLGQYPEAYKTITNALERYRSSIPLRLAAIEVFKANGRTDRAATMLEELSELGSSRSRSARDVSSLVALGKAALLLNADPKLVLENFFDQAKRVDPQYREAYLASGELALDKHDYALAAKIYTEAAKLFPDDPEAQFGLACAYAPSDTAQAAKALEAVLNYNTNHVPSLLLLVDRAVDSEAYAEAELFLARALKINPWQPEAWAYKSVLAHLHHRPEAEAEARQTALKFWGTNPLVDHLIGRKLSQKYRFAEGAECQRQALKFDPNYLPAKIQLAQDLLRLGNETDGWQLAEEVYTRDGYDATAYNLVTLRESMAKFQTLTNQDFIVRMSPREAVLYGDRVLALLQRAKDTLSKKYGLQPDRPTMVEIFPEQKDFGVRTFGMPHNPGFLGVCFGHVVTANSPASQTTHAANWEAVLWHEFCHVITLQLTKNKMPRWLSEGISVYEERQANPVWSEGINPRYREMILSDDLTPVGQLSAAFMSPKGEHSIQFAYYESSLVVEYLVDNFGLDALKKILHDLGEGMEINEAIAHHTAPLEKIEKDFTAFARQRARQLGPGLDWTKPKDTSLEAMLKDVLQVTDAAQTNTVRRGRAGASRRNQPRPRPTNNAAPESLVVIQATNLVAGNNSNLVSSLKTNTLSHATTNQIMTSTTNLLSTTATNYTMTNATSAVASGPSPQTTPLVPTGSLPNYWDLLQKAKTALSAKKWTEAKAPLQKLIDLYPTQSGPNSAYYLMAEAHRGLNETNQERQVLTKLAGMEADATVVFQRLMELDETALDWAGVAENAERFLAVNPLLPQPYRFLARAGEQLGRSDAAVRSYQRLLLLDPPDPAEVHFSLARLLRQKGESSSAKRHVLQSLEDAPRFRDAQRLLLELNAVQRENKP